MSGFEQFIQERIYLSNVSPRTVDWYPQGVQHDLPETGRHSVSRHRDHGR